MDSFTVLTVLERAAQQLVSEMVEAQADDNATYITTIDLGNGKVAQVQMVAVTDPALFMDEE
ncbi:hypothetical protein KUW19_00065 [Ferrimonas balearica]|uniref:hypothetical protein n=1 Tax=Ferrimonas balearica TaxID=44012 RepID=UPI001C940E57|nr:hypothetical protein [Ferrimonas balearica]MBY6104875.1 hypothetical protein [Ferrimonas balearica]